MPGDQIDETARPSKGHVHAGFRCGNDRRENVVVARPHVDVVEADHVTLLAKHRETCFARVRREIDAGDEPRGHRSHPSDREKRFVMCVLAVARTSPSGASVAVRICSAILVFASASRPGTAASSADDADDADAVAACTAA
ncbi:hypothetical protein [Brachybacterium sp. GPGPB12]|uniref:hypothetical protein n=1 Tax=Brachybacterium sp. GPGPB12 TaxID=3023517 RepID=UPI0031344196